MNKTKKNNLDSGLHFRCTSKDKAYIEEQAAKHGMDVPDYVRDKLTDGKQRSIYGKRKVCTSIVEISNHIDELYEVLNGLDLDPEKQERIEEIMKSVNKERDVLWNS